MSGAAKIIGTIATSLIGGLMGKQPKAPTIQKQPTAPTPDDAAKRRRRERQMASQSRGRASTIMEEENLG